MKDTLMTKKTRTATTRFFGTVTILTPEEELHIVDTIQQGKHLLDKDYVSLSRADKKLYKKSQQAIQGLLESYSPLIEKIVWENYDPSLYYVTPEDLFSEAMIIATQCAKNFDPYKGAKAPLRFSAYVSRPVASTLYKLKVKGNNVVSMPTSIILKAKKWSHPFFDMSKKGIDVSDEEVSRITGIDMTQQEVSYILDNRAGQSLDDIHHPDVVDTPRLEDDTINRVEFLIEDFSRSVSHSDAVCTALGLTHEKCAIFSGFVLSLVNKDLSRDEAQRIIDMIPTIVTHPVYRMRLHDNLVDILYEKRQENA